MQAREHDWSYSRCPGCPNAHRHVGPDGPLDAKVMLIGEGPGWNEDRDGIPFTGRAGQELDETYLRLAGLSRDEVFVTNAVQCRQERNGMDVRPAPALTRCCADNHLAEEIWTVRPEVIVLCGATACSLVGGIDLEMEHGFPRRVESCAGLYDWSGVVVPMYHPAAGLHESRFMIPLLEDFERLGKFLRGKWEPPKFTVEMPGYFLLTADGLRSDSPFRRRYPRYAVDTESDEGRPWSVQLSPRPGIAFMVLTEDTAAMRWVAECLTSADEIILHNELYDSDALDQLGIHITKYRDTMQECYHLGNMPQGLKPSTYRTTGHRMTSYDETVTPYSKRALEDWLARALSSADGLRETVPHPVGPGCPTCGKRHRKDVSVERPHESEATLRRIMNKLQEPDGASDYDPWQRPKWSKGKEHMRLLGQPWMDTLEAFCGRMPRKSIVHVPIEEAMRYGNSDADMTGRLATWLEKERERIVREEWSIA